jgi:hypothetical protein
LKAPPAARQPIYTRRQLATNYNHHHHPLTLPKRKQKLHFRLFGASTARCIIVHHCLHSASPIPASLHQKVPSLERTDIARYLQSASDIADHPALHERPVKPLSLHYAATTYLFPPSPRKRYTSWLSKILGILSKRRS